MRLSLMKAAHAVLSNAALQEIWVRWGEHGAPGAARLGSSALGLSGYAEAAITGKKISFQLASSGKHEPSRRCRLVEQHSLGQRYGGQQQTCHLLPSPNRNALPRIYAHTHVPQRPGK
jgi:hypothetical protein